MQTRLMAERSAAHCHQDFSPNLGHDLVRSPGPNTDKELDRTIGRLRTYCSRSERSDSAYKVCQSPDHSHTDMRWRKLQEPSLSRSRILLSGRPSSALLTPTLAKCSSRLALRTALRRSSLDDSLRPLGPSNQLSFGRCRCVYDRNRQQT